MLPKRRARSPAAPRVTTACSGELRIGYCRARRLTINIPEPPSRRAVTATLPGDNAGAETPAAMHAQIRSFTDPAAVGVVVGDAHQTSELLLSVSMKQPIPTAQPLSGWKPEGESNTPAMLWHAIPLLASEPATVRVWSSYASPCAAQVCAQLSPAAPRNQQPGRLPTVKPLPRHGDVGMVANPLDAHSSAPIATPIARLSMGVPFPQRALNSTLNPSGKRELSGAGGTAV